MWLPQHLLKLLLFFLFSLSYDSATAAPVAAEDFDTENTALPASAAAVENEVPARTTTSLLSALRITLKKTCAHRFRPQQGSVDGARDLLAVNEERQQNEARDRKSGSNDDKSAVADGRNPLHIQVEAKLSTSSRPKKNHSSGADSFITMMRGPLTPEVLTSLEKEDSVPSPAGTDTASQMDEGLQSAPTARFSGRAQIPSSALSLSYCDGRADSGAQSAPDCDAGRCFPFLPSFSTSWLGPALPTLFGGPQARQARTKNPLGEGTIKRGGPAAVGGAAEPTQGRSSRRLENVAAANIRVPTHHTVKRDEDLRSSLARVEAGLMLSGRPGGLLNEQQGALSFLSAQDVGSFLQASKRYSQQDMFGPGVAAAAIAQHTHDRSIENRTESCEDLFLEVLRENVGTKMPRDFWNTDVDRGLDYLKYFQLETQRESGAAVHAPDRPAADTEWSVWLLMKMAMETCNPGNAYKRGGTTSWWMYTSKVLSKGCHKSDRNFFREVLEFFQEDAPMENKSGTQRLRERWAGTSKLVLWNPPKTRSFPGQRSTPWADEPPQPVDMSLNQNRSPVVDRRCRLAMATEVLFQNPSSVYGLQFPVKLGYCLNPWNLDAAPRRPHSGFFLTDPMKMDSEWHPYFRRMFRRFADRWRSRSNGVSKRWSYDQFQWDWRSFHGKRLKYTWWYKHLFKEGRDPQILNENPADYLVEVPTKVATET
ncbi:unnamed protein product [Amoebophrya sp. A120]|nr:unnamed protein product [Amoebophrya sp. A120]|eukprot:GSA120T00004602001.1